MNNKRFPFTIFDVIVVSVLISTAVGILVFLPKNTVPPAPLTDAAGEFGKLPLAFEPNQGQTDPAVKFLSRGRGYALFLTEREAIFSLQTANEQAAVLRMSLDGANAAPEIVGQNQLGAKSNYFLGKRENWQTDVPNFGGVRYKNVYPGVDQIFVADNAGSIYVTGATYNNLPVVNPIQPNPGGGSSVFDGFVAKIFIAPPAATPIISGRITNAQGQGIGTTVLLTLTGGNLSAPLYARATPAGYYRFEAEAGQTYTVTPVPDERTFTPGNRVVTLTENIFGIDFITQ